ncbi:hypothetical protein JAAARDRAFT_197240 [Jaapia argillacea MUCL 33604]|uniref:Carbamoyl-phosphate synthetase large subunit oligomerisation domain-containing protein n=1 Tax=Jaapia argillacea MUCL 33604 TaxID=933084 RepID=A0A067PG65_9AGAM|nr:hypothetical protein JAAARDRAFT_197240 [Jaapia argillacea MUCL 33604]
MFEKKWGVNRLLDITKVDKWHLYKLDYMVQTVNAIKSVGALDKVDRDLTLRANCEGFSDLYIATLLSTPEHESCAHRNSLSVTPFVKRIDTLAAEYLARTNYLSPSPALPPPRLLL